MLTKSMYHRTLLCIGDENKTISLTEAEPNNADDQGTQYGEDIGLEVHEPSLKKKKRSMMGLKLTNRD